MRSIRIAMLVAVSVSKHLDSWLFDSDAVIALESIDEFWWRSASYSYYVFDSISSISVDLTDVLFANPQPYIEDVENSGRDGKVVGKGCYDIATDWDEAFGIGKD